MSPLGALDALTRGNLQEQLMEIAQAEQLTCVMVTHDVDEALLLSDRVVMMTNGPEARIGQILRIPFPRPRHRLEVVRHPDYYSLRGEMIYFLNQQKRARQKTPVRVAIAKHGLEKVNLEVGFVPLNDCAPLVVAQEKGLFQKHGLEQVTLVREPGWKTIWEGIRSGRLDAAMVVAGIPLASTLGVGGVPVSLVTALNPLPRRQRHYLWAQTFACEGVLSPWRICANTSTAHSRRGPHPREWCTRPPCNTSCCGTGWPARGWIRIGTSR
jgi:nitrate/nitrite transport system ATP-binding protein